MKYFYKLFFALFLLPLFSLAQTNYKPGYIVTVKGDTIHGYINYKEWEKNPKDIRFKNNRNDRNAETFTPKNTSAFGVDGFEYFKGFVVHISQDQVEISNVKQGADTSYITDAVFLRMLTTGNNVVLFSYTDKIKTRYYVEDRTEKQPVELIYRVYYSLKNSTLLQTDYGYRTQMLYFAQKYNVNSDKLEIQISQCEYEEADLIKITRVINGDTAKQFTPKSRFGIRWYAGLGVTNNNLLFVGLIKYASNGSTFPKIAAGFDLFPNKNTGQLFFRVDVSYTTNQHSFSSGPDVTDYSSRLSNLTQHSISISPEVVYNIYNFDHFKLFVNAGTSINLSSYNNYQLIENQNNVSTIVPNELFPLNKYWISFPLKAGIALYKRVEMYIGYTPSAALTNNNNYEAKVVVYDAGINYLFRIK